MVLKKPNIHDQEIITCLRNAYALESVSISFLPIGADFNTAVYRITAKAHDYFLKLRTGKFLEASVLIPKYLADTGIKHVILPIATKEGQLWTNIHPFSVILYPYVEGGNGLEFCLSDDHWKQFGSIIKELHSADIPSSITKNVPREAFSSKERGVLKVFLARIKDEIFEDSVAIKTAAFLKSKTHELHQLIAQAENLSFSLQMQPLEYVLCHADIHGWNMIVDKKGAFYVIDWDTLIFAPKERDLMFIGAGIWNSGRLPFVEKSLFYQGYGQTAINQDALCYYRFERIIQDIAEYCEHIFLSDEDTDERMQSFQYLLSNFLQNGTIQAAYQAYKK